MTGALKCVILSVQGIGFNIPYSLSQERGAMKGLLKTCLVPACRHGST